MKDTSVAVIIGLIIIVFFALMITNDYSFEKRCEEEGGVVVRGYLSRNCATSGFINIK